jgi:putative transposase
MARKPRIDLANYYYHVINRANARLPIFFLEYDYELFESLLFQSIQKFDVELVAYCIMPNHFHLLIRPLVDGEIGRCMQWLTLTHTQRWHSLNRTAGTGHLYQGRYKSFLVESGEYLATLIRYIERNPVRARLVEDAGNWEYSSYSKRFRKCSEYTPPPLPIEISGSYQEWINNDSENSNTYSKFKESIDKGKPFGSNNWVDSIVDKFKLESTTRSKGRPKKGA